MSWVVVWGYPGMMGTAGFRPHISELLRNLVLGMLKKDPGHRLLLAEIKALLVNCQSTPQHTILTHPINYSGPPVGHQVRGPADAE